jgi:hypothetical protein
VQVQFDDMVKAHVEPNEITATTLVRLATHPKEVMEAADIAQKHGISGPGLLSAAVSKLYRHTDAEGLLTWAFGFARDRSFFLPLMVFEPAIAGYRRSGKVDDALRLVMAFPHLSSSKALLSDKSLQDFARRKFTEWYDADFEPFNSSNALAVLFDFMGDSSGVIEWAERALAFPNLHKKRQDGLRQLLRKHRRPGK